MVDRIQELAAGLPPLQEALQGWAGLELSAQQARLASIVERIDYDGRSW